MASGAGVLLAHNVRQALTDLPSVLADPPWPGFAISQSRSQWRTAGVEADRRGRQSGSHRECGGHSIAVVVERRTYSPWRVRARAATAIRQHAHRRGTPLPDSITVTNVAKPGCEDFMRLAVVRSRVVTLLTGPGGCVTQTWNASRSCSPSHPN